MQTIRELEAGTIRQRRTGNEPVSSIGLHITRLYFNAPASTLLFQGSVKGSSGTTYDVNVEFADTAVNPADTFKTTMIIPVNPSVDVHVEQPKDKTSGVKVSCACQDYVFTFSHINAAKDAHFGPLQNYQRKTKTHAPRNPKQNPGLCKHLDAFIEHLRREKYLG